MSYLQLDKQSFQEYLFDINNATFAKKNKEKIDSSNLNIKDLGFFNTKVVQKGQISILHENFLVKQNITLNFKKEEQAILFSFVKKGGAIYFANEKTGIGQSFCSNTHGMYFMNLDSDTDKEILQKNKEQEFVMFFIPLSYFENLVNLYPSLFEKSFSRYHKGESFFLSENFAQTTAVHYNILSQIENSHLMGNCSTAYVDAKFLELLSMYFYSTSSKSIIKYSSLNSYDKIKEAEFILTSHLRNPPSVDSLALQVGVNPNILQAGFKEVYNNTVYGYLFDYKMQLAKQLLQDTSKSIAEVALQCGYEYSSHFCTAFKRKFGVSPNKIRKEN